MWLPQLMGCYCLHSLITANAESVEEAEYVKLGRFGFGSCNHMEHAENMFGVLQEAHLDQLLLLGDNIYADTRYGT